ncbi:MAG TPA: hypothetical protein VM598_10985, partial [Bdellovibrionota bacterium]|nr:hypothetical protein [Bdellovibrionota bacterium]
MKILRLSKLRVVVLECPYDTWDDPFTRKMFGDMVGLKVNGFKTTYPYGVLPVDSTDLVSTHLMICMQNGDDFELLLAYRSICDRRVRTHALKFPGIALAEAAQAPDHARYFQELLKEAEERRQRVRYCSSYTIKPEVRQDRALVADLKTYMTGMHMLFHKAYRTDVSLLAGVLKVKTDQYFASWGYQPIRLGGRELAPIHQASLYGEEARMMRLEDWSEHARSCAEATRDLWQNRITV